MDDNEELESNFAGFVGDFPQLQEEAPPEPVDWEPSYGDFLPYDNELIKSGIPFKEFTK